MAEVFQDALGGPGAGNAHCHQEGLGAGGLQDDRRGWVSA